MIWSVLVTSNLMSLPKGLKSSRVSVSSFFSRFTRITVFVTGLGPWTEVDNSRGEPDLGFAGTYELDINGVLQAEIF